MVANFSLKEEDELLRLRRLRGRRQTVDFMGKDNRKPETIGCGVGGSSVTFSWLYVCLLGCFFSECIFIRVVYFHLCPHRPMIFQGTGFREQHQI